MEQPPAPALGVTIVTCMAGYLIPPFLPAMRKLFSLLPLKPTPCGQLRKCKFFVNFVARGLDKIQNFALYCRRQGENEYD